jgi:hypothetical protein
MGSLDFYRCGFESRQPLCPTAGGEQFPHSCCEDIGISLIRVSPCSTALMLLLRLKRDLLDLLLSSFPALCLVCFNRRVYSQTKVSGSFDQGAMIMF